MNDHLWTRVHRPRPGAALRLVALPPAGESAAFFRFWPGLLPDDIEVRAVQYADGADDPARLAAALRELVGERVPAPYALFGHGFGAAVAHAAARGLEDAGSGPVHLFVSGSPAPEGAGPVRCPVTAIVGERDPAAGRADARSWEAVAGGGFRLRIVPGGPAYPSTERHAVIDQVLRDLHRLPSG
ncbi:thioesterase domain-containing protein [Spirillospora sp. NPDC029432]|uniref:thioesterase II family protein n=1 Tax=Spirillospora sp. NPDC029432 TaxID=3154599 RepID=UPI003456C062